MKNKIKILMGKSASGKDYISKYLIKNCGYKSIISMTTRPIRENEVDGIDYYFTDDEKFLELLGNDKFIEYRKYNTIWNNEKCVWYYGVLKEKLDFNNKFIIILDFQGMKDFVSYYGKENCEVFYIECDNKIRENRARNRGSFQEEEWLRRLADDEIKFDMNEMKDWIDKIIVNENKDISEIVKEIEYD